MNSSSRNGANVIWLAVHTTEGIMRATALRDWTTWAGSSHASSDETGALLTPDDGFVPYDRAAWTLRNGNPLSENIEQCGWARWSRAEWLARPALLDATARWLGERSQARGIPLVRLSAADIRARRPGVLGHGDYSAATRDGTHTDPGPNYPWDVVLDKARAYASGINPEEFTVAQYDEIIARFEQLREESWKQHSDAQSVRATYHAQTQARIAALTELVGQLQAGSAAVDLEAIEAAGRRGAETALKDLRIEVNTGDAAA